MNRFAANHPEDWEERLDALTDYADWKPDPAPRPLTPRPLQPCVCCGKPSRLRWCSNACFYTEDGHDEERDRE